MRFLLIGIVIGSAFAAPCLTVESDRITAADLGRQLAAFRQLDPQLTIGLAPGPGTRRLFSPRELSAIATRNANEPRMVGEAVCVERAVAPLTSGQIRRAIESAIGNPGAHIEILDFSHLQAPAGELVFARSGLMPAASPDAPALWRGTLKYDARHTIAVWARVRIFEIRTVVIASRAIRAEATITPDDLALAERNVCPFTPRLERVDDGVGYIARKAIAAGSIISGSLLRQGLEVAIGETVRVAATAGAAQIIFDAVARSSGRKGDRILLVNPESQRTFRAIVDERGRAHVVAGT